MGERKNKKPSHGVSQFFYDHPYMARAILFIIFYLAISATLYVGFNTPVTMEEARATVEKLKPLFESIIKRGNLEATAWNTFLHNSVMTLIANTPLLGFLLMLFSAYQTGLTAKMLVMVSGSPIGFTQIYFKLHTLLELAAYSLAAGESAYLSPFMFRRREEEKIPLTPTIAIVILEFSLLWAAAIVESKLIMGGGI